MSWEGIVITKHAIGKRILEDELKFGKPEYGSKRIDGLARDLEVSQSDLYYCVQFARQYPEISNTLENVSWYELTQKLLPASKEQPQVQPLEDLPEGFVTSLSDLNGQKFGCVYADPPWKYSNQATRGSTADFPLATVSGRV